MDNIKAAYLAGIIDGEGTVEIIKNNRGTYPHISITSTSLELIKWIQSYFPATIHTRSIFPKHCKQPYIIRWSSKNDVVLILDSTMPYLIVKLEQADYVMQFCDTLRNHKGPRGKNLSQEIKDLREDLWGSCKQLNKRGVYE